MNSETSSEKLDAKKSENATSTVVAAVPNDATAIYAKSTSRSFGVRTTELLNAQYSSKPLKITFFVCLFFLSYSISMDMTIQRTLTLYATSSYRNHSGFTTINVLKGVVSAASQPTYARLSDRFGRIQILVFSLVIYVVGTVIQSQAYDFNRFAAGSVIYTIGMSGIREMQQILIADFSNLNWRLVCSMVPALPTIINTWAGGDVVDSVVKRFSWQWGMGMWAFILPLCCIPLFACFAHMIVGARKTQEWADIKQEKRQKKWSETVVSLFWELDVIGIILIIVCLGCILVPFTIAGGAQTKWNKAYTIVPLVVGVLLVPVFIYWEYKFSRIPIVPFSLMKDRGVWSALIIGILINWVFDMPNDYFYTVLVVGMNASVKAATRITSLYTFVATITASILGLFIVRIRRLKGFIVFGAITWIVALGASDGIEDQKYIDGVIGGLCLFGFGAGFFTNSIRVSIASVTNHEYMGIVISLYLTSVYIGTAIGSSVSGAIWTQKMMIDLGVENADKLTALAYESPFKFIVTNTWGTNPRIAVVQAYAEVQKILCIVGLSLAFPLLITTFFLRDHRLDSVQSLELDHDHEKGIKTKDGQVVVNNYDDDIILAKLKSLFKK
ncbi:SIT1 Siderophore iron transporter 1 [Candida maltosa Xu316]